jgi:hypothetical protein
MLGDDLAKALAAVGVTLERVERFLGRPCGCKERQERLNALHGWARRVLSGRVERANEYLERLTGGES